jgi:hypothetical protein
MAHACATIDIACQVVIGILGVLSILLISFNNRWGFAAALAGQPFWYFTTIYNRQWGILVIVVIYTFSWGIGFYRRFFRKKHNPNLRPKINSEIS